LNPPNKTSQLGAELDREGVQQPFITLFFSKSLDSRQYSLSFKHAVALPLLNKENMDPTQLNNYRPVSNLPFLSKFLEKAISGMLRQHMKEIDGIPKHHSA